MVRPTCLIVAALWLALPGCRSENRDIAGASPTSTAAQPSSVPARDVLWDAVLGPSQGTWPEPAAEVVWRSDLPAALDEARETGRPLFVTARCIPCKQCADFDKDVLEGGPTLTPLLARFVTVRITDAAQLDLARLPVAGFQDLDLSWWGWFLSPQAQVYGVFGGRDEVSDGTRISAAALANTLTRVLDHHADPRRAGWALDGAEVPRSVAASSATELHGYANWLAGNREAQSQPCLHCHQVVDVLRQPALDAGTYDKRRAFDVWPLPENVGLVLDRDDGLLVTEVIGSSAADRAGLVAGDRLGAAGERKLFGQADLRGVLHRMANPTGSIELHWLRDGRRHSATLELTDGWRSTVLDWRMSVSQGNAGADPGFFPLVGKGVEMPDGGVAVEPYFGRGAATSPAHHAGLRQQHVIVAVDGQAPPSAGRGFLVWFRQRYEFGDEVVYTVIDDGTRRDIAMTLQPRG